MARLFTTLLRILPAFGAALVIAAIWRSVASGGMDQLSLILIGAGFVFFLALLLKADAAGVGYYTNLSLAAGLMLGILVCLYMLVDSHGGRLDLTSNARQSLSAQTCRILRSLTRPVRIRALAVANEPLGSYLDLFRAQNPSLVSYEIVNPYQDVALFAPPGEEPRLNSIYVTSGEGQEERRAPTVSYKGTGSPSVLENEILNAVVNVQRDRPVRLYFVTNHGEKTPQTLMSDDATRHSFSRFAEELWKMGIEVRLFDLAADRMVPDDCDMLGIAGPTSDYSFAEVGAIGAYLERGGRLLAMFDPPLSDDARMLSLRGLMKAFGLDVSEKIVLDQGSHSAEQGVHVPLVREYSPAHSITEPLQGLGALPMLFATSVAKAQDAPADMDIKPLLATSAQAWAASLAEFAEMARNQPITIPSSVQWQKYMLAMVAEPKAGAAGAWSEKPRPRIVAVGDSDFVTDAQLNKPQATLAYRMIVWLTGQDDKIALPPPAIETEAVSLEPRQWTLISIFSVVVTPFAVFFAGVVYTTVRRRAR